MARWIESQLQNSERLRSLGLPELLCQILTRRGLADPGAARAFLDPSLVISTSYPGIEPAIARLSQAARSQEPICVWGDFDVDGQTSTALLVQTLRALGANVSYHVPIRSKEGHGVNLASLDIEIDRGARLILTCDTGIAAQEAVAHARSRGVSFIVTDHHELDGPLPGALAVINPRLLPDAHPLADLSGVGVAYKLVEGLLDAGHLQPEMLEDLVGLGLVADVAALRKETRTLTQKGIEALRRTGRVGLRMIAASAQVDLTALTEETIGFSIAPRLNAVGRLGDANAAVELLLTEDPVRAGVVAAQIEGLNTQRRLLTDQVFQAAQELLRSDPRLGVAPILVLSHPSWPGGVVGIVAARLVERYQKPAILLAGGVDGVLRGSGRSVDGLHITKAIAACRDMLISFGGHPMAAGLSLPAEMLAQFRTAIGREVEKALSTADIREDVLSIEQWLNLRDLTPELAMQLEQLAPFGAGNPVPILGVRDLHLRSSKFMGAAEEHRRLLVADEGGATREVIWWNSAEEEMPEGKFDMAVSIRTNTYRGEQRAAIQLKDLRPLPAPLVEVSSRKPEVVDLRGEQAVAHLPPSCLIWTEGADSPPGFDRFHLQSAEDLAIWTIPPSRHELRAALAGVQPRTVYLVAALPKGIDTAQTFLTQLAGLTKYVLGRRNGKTSIAELAAATAQRELTVRMGLEWLAVSGHLKVEAGSDDVKLMVGDAPADQDLQRELFAGVKGLIDETAAYRAYFLEADAMALL